MIVISMLFNKVWTEKLFDSVSKSKGEDFDKTSKIFDPFNENIVNWSLTLVTAPKFVLDILSNNTFSNSKSCPF